MVTVDNAEWATRLRRLREHGMNVSAADRHASAQPVLEAYLETAYNYRMTDIQAAVGLVQLGRLAGLVAQRRALAARYQELLAGHRRPGAGPGPGLRADQLPVVLGAARRLPGRSRRGARRAGQPGRLRPARHHGRAPGAGVRGRHARARCR
jgi:hypothetical protein